jgi:hypothetical protein
MDGPFFWEDQHEERAVVVLLGEEHWGGDPRYGFIRGISTEGVRTSDATA